jgi:DNA-binding response OmpR family regulator
MSSTALLLADPEPSSRGYLERHLRHDGFEILADPRRRPDLVIADDAVEIERWRGEAPVIVLGREQADPVDRVQAFRRGCDDYLPRPFDYQELVERIRAVLRRVQPPASETVAAGPLSIDLRTRVVEVCGARVRLAQKEYALLVKLAGDPTRVFTKHELLRDVWDYRAEARTRTLDSHASRLRRKLRAADPVTPWVDNVWGVGYRLLGELPGPRPP